MNVRQLLLGALFIFLQAAAAAQAQVPGNNCAFFQPQTVVAVVGVINGGPQYVSSPSPGCHVAHSTTQVFAFVAEYSGPFVTGLGTITWGTSSFAGCNIAALTTTTTNFAAGASSRAASTITMTSTECHGFVNFDLSIGSPVVYDWPISIPIDIRVEQPNFFFWCNSPAKTANAYAPSTDTCTTPTVNDAVTGSLTLSGSLGVVNSGTQHIVVDSWPSLVAAVTDSGTLNVVNSGGQTMTVSGSLAISGGLTVTNAGGQSLTVTSWPQLQAVLSGTVNTVESGSVTVHNDGTLTVTNAGGQTMTLAGAATIHADGSLTVTNAGGQALTFAGPLTVHQDPICTAAEHCHLDTNATTVTIGNTTVNVPDHQTQIQCGPGSTPPYDAAHCKPLQSSSTTAEHWLPIGVFGLLFVAIFWRLMAAGWRWLLAFVIVTLALFAALLPGGIPDFLGGTDASLAVLASCVWIVGLIAGFGFKKTGSAVSA